MKARRRRHVIRPPQMLIEPDICERCGARRAAQGYRWRLNGKPAPYCVTP